MPNDTFGELEHLKFHSRFMETLNVDGCHYGELLSLTMAQMQKKITSEVVSFEATAKAMLELANKNKTEMEGIKKMALDAISCTSAAKEAVDSMAEKSEIVRGHLDKVGWKLLWIVLGGNGFLMAAYIAIDFLLKR